MRSFSSRPAGWGLGAGVMRSASAQWMAATGSLESAYPPQEMGPRRWVVMRMS